MSAADLKSLLAIIEDQLDWGDPSGWQGKDFEILNLRSEISSVALLVRFVSYAATDARQAEKYS